MSPSTVDPRVPVTVIGAGVAGLAAAVELAERGAKVEVVEKQAAPGPASCSWHAGGMLAPFCERAGADPIIADLGADAVDWWSRRFAGTVQRGSLVVALPRDAGELDGFARRTSGFAWLEGAGVAALEPDLAGRFDRALYFAEEGHLDPRAALAGLVARLEDLGVPVRFGHGVEPHRAAGGIVLDCRGLAARDRLAGLRGVRGEMLLVRSLEVAITRPVRLLHPRAPLYLVPRGEGVFMLGATSIESDWGGGTTVRSALDLLGAAFALHPAFGEAEILEFGAGVRPAFPDNLPRVERHNDTISINGLYRHGFLLAPAMARRAAEAVVAATEAA